MLSATPFLYIGPTSHSLYHPPKIVTSGRDQAVKDISNYNNVNKERRK
jgi:hypothetical protein